ncbi:DNA-3-methyladenine glycosylase [Phycicoccus sp. DTK01]|uniref:DNA-3-methyladenine glycosylase n=1 Tax=Phycicoccus sp. DTK01 TaxID=2785745 RepID=UPI001A8E93F4|nr:DNA-3-methyladenine glycosylase [Phycicoccus sp. DTK01]GIL37130.1 putative 3-methyladenine DNA glycosylase [Phycicoccus sp. DTK01]
MPGVAEVLRSDVLDVAPRLLGAHLAHAGVTLRITEVEAYAGSADPGSHAFRGRTPRTEVMFGRAGLLYVYFTYGMHFCANVVTGPEGSASAVLLRAGEVVDGHATAAERRPGVRARDLARGPARLTRTLALGREQNGLDLLDPATDGRLVLADPPDPAVVATGPRVGVSGAGGDGAAFPWRFWLAGEPTVSPYRAAVARRRPASGRG